MSDDYLTVYYPVKQTDRLCPVCLISNVSNGNCESLGPDVVTENPTDSGHIDAEGNDVAPTMTNTSTSLFSCDQGHTWKEQSPCF